MTEAYDVVRLSPLRKVIGTRMTEAKRTIPHFRLVAEIELDALLALRQEVNAARPDCKISVNDCAVKACADALMQNPALNIQLVGDEIHRYHEADISVVIAIDDGLAAPIVRAANRKSVFEIARELRSLTTRAIAGRLSMHEIIGGSFSISNLGGYEVDQFDAIINPPQCAILAVGRAEPRCLVNDRREVRVATTARITLSVDHRAIDGAVAAKFLSTLRHCLEHPRELFRQ